MAHPYAAGAMASTTSDLARWDRALRKSSLIRDKTLEQATSPFQLNDGTLSPYGYGWAIGCCAGARTFEHGGLVAGFSAYNLHIPAEEIFVAILSNYQWGLPREAIAVQLAEVALDSPASIPDAVQISSQAMERYVGVYRIDENTYRTVLVEDGRLVTQHSQGRRTRWIAASDESFFDEECRYYSSDSFRKKTESIT